MKKNKISQYNNLYNKKIKIKFKKKKKKKKKIGIYLL